VKHGSLGSEICYAEHIKPSTNRLGRPSTELVATPVIKKSHTTELYHIINVQGRYIPTHESQMMPENRKEHKTNRFQKIQSNPTPNPSSPVPYLLTILYSGKFT
jgi:hypothetical protein